MVGSVSLLTLILLAASPEDAGLATISDQSPGVGIAVSSDDGKATLAGHTVPSVKEDIGEERSLSVLHAMLQEQSPKTVDLPLNQKVRENPFKEEEESPFKEEGPSPGADPPERLPSATGVPGLAEAGDMGGVGGMGGYAADSYLPTCEGKPCAAGCGRMGLCDWFGDICYEGWIDQGVTLNMYSPRNRSNFPVGFNNRSNDYQLNQAYLRLARGVNRDCDRWDVGGTVDLLYGTDSLYASSRGLEVDRNFGPKWNAQQYGLAMPQCYVEVLAPWGEDGLSVKLGHFYTILGYETTPAPENFFYSHSFCLIYGEPVTETGLLGEKKFGNFKVQAGVTRGWDNWEDNNDDLSFLGGFGWSDDEDRTSLAFAIQSGPEQNEPPQNANTRNVFSVVLQQKMGERFKYVLQYDYGSEERTAVLLQPMAEWHGLSQYLFYTINERWQAGLRCEWFRDQDGVRITQGRQGADYYELTAGLNWKPTCRIAVRPELRYDWVGTPNYTPYVDSSKSYQLLLGCDVIVKF